MADRKEHYRLLAKTAARKSPRQLLGILSRKARNRVVPRLPIDIDERYCRRIPDNLEIELEPHTVDTRRLRSSLSQEEIDRYQHLSSEFADGRITFLNRTRELSDPAVISPDDSRLSELPRLWFIKLAAYEPFRWGILGYDRSDETRKFTNRVDSWLDTSIAREHIGNRTGYLRGFWAPYSVSLRIIALSRYGAWRNGLDDVERRFLYKNLLFLEKNVERDVGGNHLIENGAALVIGGCVFPGSGDRFVRKGLDVLMSTSETQFLDDGYHFERSPMYHLEITERLLSVLSIFDVSDSVPPGWLIETISEACSFIEYLRPPDNRIPLLNDAVFGQAHSIETVLSYASSIDISIKSLDESGESELNWFGTDRMTLLIDAGDSGPAHQMAHTHNDPATILLWMDSTRMITDTGVFDYQPGNKRAISRSVRAHNTVQVDDFEPIEYGGRFRMAGTIDSTSTTTQDGISMLTVNYAVGDRESYHHRRTVYAGGSWLLVWDNIEADSFPFFSRLHLHPHVSVQDESALTFTHKEGPRLYFAPVKMDTVEVVSGSYFPRFGVETERSTVEMGTTNRKFGYFLMEQDIPMKLECTDSKPTAVRIDDQLQSLPKI